MLYAESFDTSMRSMDWLAKLLIPREFPICWMSPPPSWFIAMDTWSERRHCTRYLVLIDGARLTGWKTHLERLRGRGRSIE